MDENLEKEIIQMKKEEKEYYKLLGKKTLFKFECDEIYGNLRIGLKEINRYSPYYYEKFYSKQELDEKNTVFKSQNNIGQVKNQLLKLFKKNSTLKLANDGINIIVSFEIANFAEIITIEFELERKTMENKDKGLEILFQIQKKNIEIFSEIKKECENNSKDPAAVGILQLLNRLEL